MSKSDFDNFVYKIDQLNKLVKLVKQSPEKYQLFINCKTHDEIVKLADSWGYEIGKRWGEN